MARVFGGLFGGRPKQPTVQVAQPVEKVVQTESERARLIKQLGKRKRATILNQVTSQANVSRQPLGAA